MFLHQAKLGWPAEPYLLPELLQTKKVSKGKFRAESREDPLHNSYACRACRNSSIKFNMRNTPFYQKFRLKSIAKFEKFFIKTKNS